MPEIHSIYQWLIISNDPCYTLAHTMHEVLLHVYNVCIWINSMKTTFACQSDANGTNPRRESVAVAEFTRKDWHFLVLQAVSWSPPNGIWHLPSSAHGTKAHTSLSTSIMPSVMFSLCGIIPKGIYEKEVCVYMCVCVWERKVYGENGLRPLTIRLTD